MFVYFFDSVSLLHTHIRLLLRVHFPITPNSHLSHQLLILDSLSQGLRAQLPQPETAMPVLSHAGCYQVLSKV